MDEDEHPGEGELSSRAPTPQDLADLCRILNDSGTRYIVVGGFAISGAGYSRETLDLDLVVATDPENEAKVYKALESLPDKAVLELEPGEIAKYTVVRVGDEICVDLMASAKTTPRRFSGKVTKGSFRHESIFRIRSRVRFPGSRRGEDADRVKAGWRAA